MAEPPAGPLRIVMADDNYLVREGARRLLEDSGEVLVEAAVGPRPACSAPSRGCARPRCSPTSGCRPARARLPAAPVGIIGGKTRQRHLHQAQPDLRADHPPPRHRGPDIPARRRPARLNPAEIPGGQPQPDLGLITLLSLVPARRGSRGALIAVVVTRVISALLAVPAFFLNAPVWVMIVEGFVIVATITALTLMRQQGNRLA